MRPGAPPPPPQGESARPPRALWSWVRGREPASGAETWTWRLRGGGVALPMETATLAWPRPKRGWGAEALSPNRAVKVSPSGRFLSFAFPPLLFRVQWLRALVAEGGGGGSPPSPPPPRPSTAPGSRWSDSPLGPSPRGPPPSPPPHRRPILLRLRLLSADLLVCCQRGSGRARGQPAPDELEDFVEEDDG